MPDPKAYILAIAQKLATQKARVELAGIKSAQGVINRRIFNDGKAADGSSIGKYGIKPGYFDKDEFVNASSFHPVGKNPDKQNKNGTGRKQKFVGGNKKLRKTMYLDEGYKELRSIQGFEVEYTDLSYSGSLNQSVQPNLNNQIPELGIYSPKEVKIANALEEKYGKTIFSPSTDEKASTLNAMRLELQTILKEINNG